MSNNYKAGYCNGDVGVITEIHNGMTVSLGDETVSLGEYDLDELATKRLEWGLFRDRRPEMYRIIAGQK